MSTIFGNPKIEHLQRAFHSAAKQSGVSFDFLVKTAARESGFRSSAKATTSSAAGLFQFIEQTWLGMVSKHGARYGLATESSAIQQSSNGRFNVEDPALRNRILGLRHDPAISTAMAAELTAENQQALQTKLGHKPSDTELYLAHFMGAGKAVSFLQAMSASPQKSATSLFAAEAKANPAVFKTKNGQERSLTQVFGHLGRLHGDESKIKLPIDNNPIAISGEVMRGVVKITHAMSPSPIIRLSPIMVQLLAELSAPKAPNDPSNKN